MVSIGANVFNLQDLIKLWNPRVCITNCTKYFYDLLSPCPLRSRRTHSLNGQPAHLYLPKRWAPLQGSGLACFEASRVSRANRFLLKKVQFVIHTTQEAATDRRDDQEKFCTCVSKPRHLYLWLCLCIVISVKIVSDLAQANVYLSIYNAEDKNALLQNSSQCYASA